MPSTDVYQLNPKCRALAIALVKECMKQGIKIKITQTYRTNAYQVELRKKLGKVAALPGYSMHEFRDAFDVCINDIADSYNIAKLTKVGLIGEKLGLTWGGRFDNVDRPHFQYTKPYTEKQIIASKGMKIPA